VGLADELLAAGPDAPTLCAGWITRDLAAHLVTRERRPDAGPGILLQPFAGWTDRVRNRYRDRYSYPELIDMIRQPVRWSPLRIPALDELTNVAEFFIHREDVRRAEPGWQPRQLDDGLAGTLWRPVPGLARRWLRRIPAEVTVTAPGFGTFTSGHHPRRTGDGTGRAAVTVTGEPAELILFFFGRRQVARVEITGPDAVVARMRGRPREAG
jgi:uncharacterized protein (TIGR03085 family)